MSSPAGRFPMRSPEHLPLLAGLTGAALLAGFGVIQTAADISFGRPSSTTALGFVVAPIVGVIAGVGIFALASVLLWLLRRLNVKPASAPIPSWVLGLVVLSVIGALGTLFVRTRTEVLAREAERRPRVILDSALLIPLAQAPATVDGRTDAAIQYDLTAPGEPATPITWNGRAISLDAMQEQVLVRNAGDAAGKAIAATDLSGFDYILNLRALPVCTQPDGRQLLAVLAMLRATSQRSMLLVYDADGALIFQEHLERRGMNSALATGKQGGAEIITVDVGTTARAWSCAAGGPRQAEGRR